MNKYAISALAIVGVVAALFLLVRPTSGPAPRPTVPRVALALHGITNVAGEGTYVAFTVSNPGPRLVAFSPDAVEFFDGRGWITNSLRNMPRLDWLYWYQDLSGNLRVGNWHDWGGDLEPGAVATFAAPVLITNAPWRLHFYCVEQATGFQGLVDRTGDLLQHTASVLTNGAARNQGTFSGKRYYLISPQITQ